MHKVIWIVILQHFKGGINLKFQLLGESCGKPSKIFPHLFWKPLKVSFSNLFHFVSWVKIFSNSRAQDIKISIQESSSKKKYWLFFVWKLETVSFWKSILRKNQEISEIWYRFFQVLIIWTFWLGMVLNLWYLRSFGRISTEFLSNFLFWIFNNFLSFSYF